MKIDVTDKIERLEALEERLGIVLGSMSAYCEIYEHTSDTHLYVYGELQASDGLELKERILLICAAYDSKGRVVNTGYDCFDPNSFYATETLSISISLPGNDLSKIRIYPKKNT